jgi:hypothetical protein
MKIEVLTTYTDEQLLDLLQPTACAQCGTKLHESRTGMRKVTGGKCLCSACYFKRVGEAIDRHPIGAPRMHR